MITLVCGWSHAVNSYECKLNHSRIGRHIFDARINGMLYHTVSYAISSIQGRTPWRVYAYGTGPAQSIIAASKPCSKIVLLGHCTICTIH